MTVHDDAPAADDDPAGHGVHTEAPAVPVYVPAKHDVHVDPAVEEYVPTAQGAQDDAPAADDDPAGHGVHTEAPAVSVYDPAKHNVHLDSTVE